MTKEMPVMLVVGTEQTQSQRLQEAGGLAGFEVQAITSMETCPARSELDPDLVITTSEATSGSGDALPSVLRSRWVGMLAEEDWEKATEVEAQELIAAEASVAELKYRLPQVLKLIQRQVWARMGLPLVDSSEALWELIPSTDWVTGLDNRLRFLQELQKNISRSQRYKRPFCCLLVRFDNYEKLYGSSGGQECVNQILEEVAGLLEVSIRDADFLARMHNDLFGLLLPETDLDNGQRVIQRIETNLQQFQFGHTQPEMPRFSCGMSAFDHETANVDALLAEAQRALDVSPAP